MSFAICSLTIKLLTGAVIILTGKVYIRMLIITEQLAITDDRVRDSFVNLRTVRRNYSGA